AAIGAAAPAPAAAQGPPPPARLAARSLGVERSERETYAVRVVAEGLRTPWSIAFLANDEFLVTERGAGRLARLNLWTRSLEYVDGLPDIQLGGDAGLRDVVLHPDYDANGWIYLSYSEPADSGSTLAVDRARLDGLTLVDRERLFTAAQSADTLVHYGGRVALRDGYLYVTVGDRGEGARAQDAADHGGKLIRLLDDGGVPPDNPFVGRSDARPEVWSLGHRNPQGLVFHPATGALWSNEHGPIGGDEINVIRPGANYGWPAITFGRDDTGEDPPEAPTHADGMEQPAYFFVPSIGPSDLSFYTGDRFPGWTGNAFVAALAQRHLLRLVVDGERVQHAERLLEERGWRVRFARQAPDGTIYVGVDGGGAEGGLLLRLAPPELGDR
ncbi:MAG: PQQ-dependent sugar dehydrogenase, partial [Gemmatimonadota bacterium]